MTHQDALKYFDEAVKYTIIVSIRPKPAPRPIFGGMSKKGGKKFARLIQAPQYKDYLSHLGDGLKECIRENPSPKAKWFGYYIECGFSYPKNTKQAYRIEGKLLPIHKDADNLAKPVMDALQAIEFVSNDSCFTLGLISKVRTIHDDYIKVTLFGKRIESPHPTLF